MVKTMTPYERATAALANEPVDELPAYPLACAIGRRLLPQKTTLHEMSVNAKACADSFIAAANKYKFSYTVTLIDLAVQAHDYGAEVRMDEENTAFVTGHVVHSPEDYEKFQPLDVTKGRIAYLIEANRQIAAGLKNKAFVACHVEGPLLALSQSAGAERLFMDMFSDPEPVLKALTNTTETCSRIAKEIAKTDAPALLWNFLWGNYSVLGDNEYKQFEANDKYAYKLIKETHDLGLGFAIHNCADMPHLDTQIKQYKPDLYSMAYYPLNPSSPSATKVIDGGYADHCVIAGQIDPQLFARGTPAKMDAAVGSLCQEVKTGLCKHNLNSKWCIASGCEVPPELKTPMENIQAFMDGVDNHGKMSS
ncbi:MAG: uroporphyrinogen decarboxylase family protein [Candidatus Methanomethylophilus sp.]|nr:uroporphyrinogen decarboxylase family protein [Methanomethylophilus sp.]